MGCCANVGFFSIYAPHQGIRVLAFEPDQITCGIINKNIYLTNPQTKIVSIPVVLNDETKISTLNMGNFMPANAYNTFDRTKNDQGEEFKEEFRQGAVGIKGDDLILDKNLELFSKPTFIKIDVDGNEYKVLRGLSNILKTSTYLCIELGYSHPEFDNVQKLLNEAGFKEIENERYFDKKRHGVGMRNFYYQRNSV